MRSNVRRLVMDQVTKVRQHFKREEWKSIISECRATVEVNEGTSQQTIQAVLLALQSIC